MFHIDLHTHTADDPWDRIPHSAADLIAHAARLGLDALAITLHDKPYDPEPMAGFASRLGVTLIPGVERAIDGRHVLLLNFPAAATRAVTSFDDVRDLRVHHRQGLVIAPHPFYPLTNCLGALVDRHADLFDAVEYNGCYTTLLNFNHRAVRWAAAHGKPVVGCSDAHRLEVLGRTCSLVDAAGPTADDICAAIKQGRVSVRTRPLSSLELARYLAKMTLAGHHTATARKEAAARGPA